MEKAICPVCNTDEFVFYEYGTHAGDFDGSYDSREIYTCKKCSGRFNILKTAGKAGEIKSVKIEWKKDIPYTGSRTIA